MKSTVKVMVVVYHSCEAMGKSRIMRERGVLFRVVQKRRLFIRGIHSLSMQHMRLYQYSLYITPYD